MHVLRGQNSVIQGAVTGLDGSHLTSWDKQIPSLTMSVGTVSSGSKSVLQ